MEDSRDLVARVEREIAASSRTSATPPGQTEVPAQTSATTPAKADAALVEAINQVFALFRLNYHNQYFAAYSDEQQLRQAKKLWLESLSGYPPAQILHGAKRAIESSDYLPTLNRMRNHCADCLPELGLPAPDAAYREASNAAQPAEAQRWSHPAVYFAGRDCGWTFLASATAKQSEEPFREHYQRRCAQALSAEGLPPIPQPAEDRLEQKPLTGELAMEEVRKLREHNDL